MYYLKKKKKPKKEVLFPKAKPKTKSVSSLVRKLDGIFSEYIRLRDSKPYGYKYCKCISCGLLKPYEDFDCGHFVGRKNMATRFHEWNCNAECKACNRFSSDHIIYYARNLEAKIGKDKMDTLVVLGKGTKKWSVWELEILITHYKSEVAKMKIERGW